MLPLRLTRRSLAPLALAVGLVLGVGCSSKGTENTNPGSITLSIDPTTASVFLGGSVPVVATITRNGGFTGTVNLTVTGATGLSAVVSNVQTNGNVTTATVTISAEAAAPAGTFPLTVHATGAGIAEATAVLTLTIAPLPPAYQLIVNNTPSIVQGGSGIANVVLVRQNFTGAVTLSLEALPAGITGVINTNPVTGGTAAITMSALASVTPGTYNMTLRGTSTLADRTQILTVIVTAAAPTGSFTLTTTPTPSVNVTQGGNVIVTVNVLRTGGFTGAVTLTATGNPAGLAAGLAPNPTTGNGTLTLTASAGLGVGAYPIVIRGNSSGIAEQTANLTVNVVAPSGSGNVTVSFVGCPISQKPLWAASQNGSGPFQVATPLSEVYTFTVNQGRGAFAYILRGGSGTSQVVQLHMSQAEWTAGTISLCPGSATAGTKVINVNVAGHGSGEIATVSFGGGTNFVLHPVATTQLNAVLDGSHDLLGYTRPIAGPAAGDRGYLLRDQNPAHLSTVTVDFGGAQPPVFTPVPATINVNGLVGAESLGHGMFYHTGATCDAATFYFGVPGGATSFTAYGVPVGIQRGGDRHGLFVSGSAPPRFRSVIEYFHDLAARTVTLPSSLPAPTITELGVGYSRRRMVVMLPADLPGSVTFIYAQNGSQKSATLTATPAYLAGPAVDLVLGDFAGLAGWDPSAAPSVGSLADYSVTASSSNASGSLCTGTNVRVLSSSFAGSN